MVISLSEQKANIVMIRYALPTLLFTLSVVILSTSCNDGKTIKPSAKDIDAVSETADLDIETNEPTILFFGNSLTAGYGLDPEDSFPSRIDDIIDSLGLSYKVVNAGLSGETTSGGLNRIDWVLSQRVDIFVLELGANDMLRGLPLTETEKNLKAIMDRVKAKYPDATIVLAEMLAAPNMGKEYADEFKMIYTRLAKSESVLLMPFFLQDVADRSEYILPDGKHPNAEGQKIVASYIWGYLQRAAL